METTNNDETLINVAEEQLNVNKDVPQSNKYGIKVEVNLTSIFKITWKNYISLTSAECRKDKIKN